MEFREATQADVEFVVDHSISRGCLSKEPEVTDYNYALEHDGIVLGIGGIRIMTPTVAWCYVNWTHYTAEHLKTCYRVVSEYMEIFCKDHNIRRLQAYVSADFPEAIRLAQHLGFHKESIMENFVDGRPALMYVRFFEEES